MTKPLFLDADPYFGTLVTGLDPPNRDKWDSYLDVEPVRMIPHICTHIHLYPLSLSLPLLS